MDGAFDVSSMFSEAFTPIIKGTEQTFAGVSSSYVPGTLSQNIANNTPTPTQSSGDEGIIIGRDNTFTGGISASLPIIAPALWAMLNLSEMELEAAKESARSSKLSLVNQVTKAYYSVLLAQDSYNVIKRSYNNTQVNAKIAESKFKQGTLSEFEWIRADVQARNARTNLVSAESAVNLSVLQLKMLMGIDMQTEIGINGKLSDYHQSRYADIMTVDTTNLGANSDLKQLNIQMKQLEQSRKINLSSALPTLAASINYQYMSMVNDNKTFTENHYWFPTSSLGVSLSIPLFQGGIKSSKNKQIKIQQEELAYQRENIYRGLELQITSYLDNMKKAIEKSESNKEGLRQAEKALTISQKMYEVGMATFLDVSNAELLYIQAGLAYNQSIYEYLSTKSDLEKVLGKEYN
ncbi:Outer membrane protein TolC [bioreactor metagenome]|uniref:Outer membrane protein TolC n=1 Tax=bioreactor metagenome TaxID=1076179 RepID=A0A645A665_9ZZZZ